MIPWHFQFVTTSTEARIKHLFELASAAKDQTELNKIGRELRAAIAEHGRSVKRSRPAKPSVTTARNPSRADRWTGRE